MRTGKISNLIVFDDVMAQAVRTPGTKSIHCLLGHFGHVNLAELWQIPCDLFIAWWALHCRQPFGQWRLWTVT